MYEPFPQTPNITRIAPVRRRRRSRQPRNGKFFVFLVFVWLRMVDAAILHWIYPIAGATAQHYLMAGVLSFATWTTVLLTAIWCRHRFAQILLGGSLAFAVLVALAAVPSLPDLAHPKTQILAIFGFTAGYLPIALYVLVSRSITKLTYRRR